MPAPSRPSRSRRRRPPRAGGANRVFRAPGAATRGEGDAER